jgi:hypothetical protein
MCRSCSRVLTSCWTCPWSREPKPFKNHMRQSFLCVNFLNAYKVLYMSLLPSKTKETVFQIPNRTIWTQNKAYKSGLAPDARCLRCEETETMEHLLYSCENYSAKIWELAGRSMTLAILRHTGDYIPNKLYSSWDYFQQTPSFHSSSHHRCHYTQSLDPISSRD